MDDDYRPEDDEDLEDLEELEDLDSLDSTQDPDQEPPSFSEDIDTGDIEIEDTASQVASTPGKNIVLMGILVIASIAFLYNMVFKEDEAEKEKKKLEKIIKSQPVETAQEATKKDEQIQVDIGVIEAPDLPDIEGLQPLPPPLSLEEPEIAFPDESFGGFEPEPEPAKPEPQPIVQQPLPTVQVVEPVEEPIEEVKEPAPPEIVARGPTPEELAARKAARRKSGMMVMNGGGSPTDTSQDETEEGAAKTKPLSTKTLSQTGAEQITATMIGNTNFMIAQGKMIDAILETAINTDLAGSLRAVISRDVYAESGKNILIPRGSRLIGEYNNTVEKGQERIIVTWNRVIRPDGVDIMLDSPGTDQLGRAGMTGLVDNKYFEILSHAFLLSAVTIGGTILADGIETSQGTSSSTTTGSDGSSTTSQTGTPTDFAVLESAGNISDIASSITEGLLQDQPTIVVNQGSRIKVFVNKDLIFPESSVGKTRFIN